MLQSVLFIYGIHLLSEQKINLRYLSIALAITMTTTYFAREMLTYGTHTMISIIILIILCVWLFKIPAQKAVKHTLLLTIFMFLFEGLILLVFTLLGIPEDFLSSVSGKIAAGIISNVMLAITLLVIRFIKKRPKRQR
jgi:hypothetical protein